MMVHPLGLIALLTRSSAFIRFNTTHEVIGNIYGFLIHSRFGLSIRKHQISIPQIRWTTHFPHCQSTFESAHWLSMPLSSILAHHCFIFDVNKILRHQTSNFLTTHFISITSLKLVSTPIFTNLPSHHNLHILIFLIDTYNWCGWKFGPLLYYFIIFVLFFACSKAMTLWFRNDYLQKLGNRLEQTPSIRLPVSAVSMFTRIGYSTHQTPRPEADVFVAINSPYWMDHLPKRILGRLRDRTQPWSYSNI